MKNNNGFLLFEALVAIVVASTVLIIVLQGLGNSLKGESVAENYLKALILAEKQMALLEEQDSVELGRESGTFSVELYPEDIFSSKLHTCSLFAYLNRFIKFNLIKALGKLLLKRFC